MEVHACYRVTSPRLIIGLWVSDFISSALVAFRELRFSKDEREELKRRREGHLHQVGHY
jgi:hypothetical protein